MSPKKIRWIYLLRGIFGMFIFGPTTMICIFLVVGSSFFSRLYFKDERSFQNGIIRFWSNLALSLFSVRLEVEGVQNVPQGSCLFLFNHMSFYDIFSMLAALDDFRFGAKIELYRIPFFSTAMKHAGVLPIARDDRDKVIEVYQQAQERVNQGERFALAPEGTRQQEYKLGSFKSGPFIFALQTKTPIVPVIITGAYEVMKPGQWIPNIDCQERYIRILILQPIPVESYQLDRRHELIQIVHHLMSDALESEKNRYFQMSKPIKSGS